MSLPFFAKIHLGDNGEYLIHFYRMFSRFELKKNQFSWRAFFVLSLGNSAESRTCENVCKLLTSDRRIRHSPWRRSAVELDPPIPEPLRQKFGRCKCKDYIIKTNDKMIFRKWNEEKFITYLCLIFSLSYLFIFFAVKNLSFSNNI